MITPKEEAQIWRNVAKTIEEDIISYEETLVWPISAFTGLCGRLNIEFCRFIRLSSNCIYSNEQYKDLNKLRDKLHAIFYKDALSWSNENHYKTFTIAYYWKDKDGFVDVNSMNERIIAACLLACLAEDEEENGTPN